MQYGSVEFRPTNNEDLPGKKRAILDYDSAVQEYNILCIQNRPNTGFNYLTIEALQ